MMSVNFSGIRQLVNWCLLCFQELDNLFNRVCVVFLEIRQLVKLFLLCFEELDSLLTGFCAFFFRNYTTC